MLVFRSGNGWFGQRYTTGSRENHMLCGSKNRSLSVGIFSHRYMHSNAHHRGRETERIWIAVVPVRNTIKTRVKVDPLNPDKLVLVINRLEDIGLIHGI